VWGCIAGFPSAGLRLPAVAAAAAGAVMHHAPVRWAVMDGRVGGRVGWFPFCLLSCTTI
jgi:hypothetical protein